MCTSNDLLNVLKPSAVHTSLAFDAVEDIDDMVVLGIYDGETTTHDADTYDGVIEGFYFSSKRLLSNLVEAIRVIDINHNGIFLHVDGTYKLLLNGWTMLIVSISCLTYCRERKEFPHCARPIAFGFVKTESQASYSGLFKCVTYAFATFYDIHDIPVRAANTDRTACYT